MTVLRYALRATLTLLLAGFACAAYSQAFSVTVSQCPSPQTGATTASSIVINCGGSSTGGSPTCTFTPSNPQVLTNTQVTIQANCTGFSGTIAYNWGSSNCSQANSPAASTCVVIPPANGAMSQQVTLIATDLPASDQYSGNTTVTYAAPSCTIGGTTTGTIGSALTLTANCTPSNFVPTSYTWSSDNNAITTCSPGTSSSCALTASGSTTVSATIKVTAADGLGNSITSPGVTATFSASSSGLPSSCSYNTYAVGNVSNPIVKNLTVLGYAGLTYPQSNSYNPQLGSANMAVFQMIAGSSVSSGHSFSWSEFGGPAANRLVYASNVGPCDLSSSTLMKSSAEGTLSIAVTSTGGGYSGGVLNMAPGETWYIMFVDYSLDLLRGDNTFGYPTKSSCTGSCPATISVR